MKILVISDTHRNTQQAEAVIEYYLKEKAIDGVIHCGDHIGDARALSKKYPALAFYMVPGNCDEEGHGTDTSLWTEIEGVTFFVVHGHKHGVKYDYSELYVDGEAHNAQVVVFGHSHCADIEKKNGIILLNPGSIAEPRDTVYPSFALVTIEANQVENIALYLITGHNQFTPHPSYKL